MGLEVAWYAVFHRVLLFSVTANVYVQGLIFKLRCQNSDNQLYTKYLCQIRFRLNDSLIYGKHIKLFVLRANRCSLHDYQNRLTHG